MYYILYEGLKIESNEPVYSGADTGGARGALASPLVIILNC